MKRLEFTRLKGNKTAILIADHLCENFQMYKTPKPSIHPDNAFKMYAFKQLPEKLRDVADSIRYKIGYDKIAVLNGDRLPFGYYLIADFEVDDRIFNVLEKISKHADSPDKLGSL